MSEYGIEISNYQAGSIYGVELGVRDQYDRTSAMLTNSLFLDFLLQNGLNVRRGDFTRDVICIQFDYGTRTYDDEIESLCSRANKAKEDYRLIKSFGNKSEIKQAEHRRNYIANLYQSAIENKEKFCKTSKEEIRTKFYTEGVPIHYKTYNKDGEMIKSETIRYRMLYRTPGKAKRGTCMFICEKLYKKARNFLYMGIKLPKKNAPIVEIGAYSSLIASTIVSRIQIRPEEILVLNDVESSFKTKVVAIKTDENKQCYAERLDSYEVSNVLFDGQAMIDASIFPEWASGYILLRHHMCKMAAFSTNLQQFFKDYFGDDYETATVKDMWGNERKVTEVKLVTTDQAMKWIKFGVGYDYWSEWIKKNDCMFGIVKTVHDSKLGNVQRMSYQMVNALSEEIMPDVISESVKYIEKLKSDDYIFVEYLKKAANFSNDYDVLAILAERNPEFVRSSYFRSRKKEVIRGYVADFKNGRAIQNADNLTIMGSPYAMLLHAVGEDCLTDPTFKVEPDAIQCYSERFLDGEYLAEFRSPFNSRNNLGYLHNVLHPQIRKYFNLGKLCIAVNMIGTDAQARNNGADQDSDSIYVTNQASIVEHARYCYENYPTIVNLIPKEKNHYSSSLEDFALVDNKLGAAQLAIGEASNLAQLSLSYTYNFDDPKFDDNTCILSVLAQVAIDNTKRTFDINIMDEINRIKKSLDVENNKYPAFFLAIRPGFNSKRINKDLSCPMNFIYNLQVSKFKDYRSSLPMSEFFVPHKIGNDRRNSKKVEELIQNYSLKLYEYNSADTSNSEEYIILRHDFEKLIDDIKAINISRNYQGMMAWLINRAFMITPGVKRNQNTVESNLNKNRSLLLKVLYTVNPYVFLQCFKTTQDMVEIRTLNNNEASQSPEFQVKN